MSGAEYALLGNILLGTVVAFFGIALPGYWLIRKWWPESGWNLGGSVSTSPIRALDLVVVGAFMVMYVSAWRGMLQTQVEVTTARLVAGALGMLLMGGLVPLLIFWRASVVEFLGLRWERWRQVFVIAPVFVLSIFAVMVLVYVTGWQGWVNERFGGGSQALVKALETTKDWKFMGAALFVAVVVAPVVEEVIFRGYIYPVVKRFSEKWFAALFSGVLFGVIHFNLASFPVLAVMGILLVVLYERTGSIWPPIACHALFNGTQMAIMLIAKGAGAS